MRKFMKEPTKKSKKSVIKALEQYIINVLKQYKTMPNRIKWFIVIWFIGAFGGIMFPFVVPFYKSQHLNGTQILALQSIFMLVSMVAEIPTGIVADKYGKKLSVVLGDLMYAFGALVYFFTGTFYMFILAETFMGIGKALNSGADEALLYDTLKELKMERLANNISALSQNISLVGLIVSNVLGSIVVKFVSLNMLWLFTVGFILLTTLFYTKIPEPKVETNEEFIPDYLNILRTSVRHIKKTPILLFYIILGLFMTLTGYWGGMWVAQQYFVYIGLSASFFGITFVLRDVLSLLINFMWPRLYDKFGLKMLVFCNQGLGFMFILGGVASFILTHNAIIGAIIITFGSALFNEARGYLYKDMQENIPSHIRATVNSFASMLRSLIIGAFNPFVGLLIDKNIYLAQLGLPFLFIVISFWMLIGYKSH